VYNKPLRGWQGQPVTIKRSGFRPRSTIWVALL